MGSGNPLSLLPTCPLASSWTSRCPRPVTACPDAMTAHGVTTGRLICFPDHHMLNSRGAAVLYGTALVSPATSASPLFHPQPVPPGGERGRNGPIAWPKLSKRFHVNVTARKGREKGQKPSKLQLPVRNLERS
jgi:hypothetical protein